MLMVACIACIPLVYILLSLLRYLLQSYTHRIPCQEWAQEVSEGRGIKVVGFFHPYCNAGGGGERVLWVAIRALQKRNITFFHPYCNAGGGGERVLWVAIRALQKRYDHLRFVVYTGDNVTRDDILRMARQRFNITFTHPEWIHFVFLQHRRWVEASPYPCFTLLGQSLGSMVLAMEAMLHCIPDVFIDSMGYAFTYPLVRYLACCQHIACYVHYPTISTDMLQRVAQRRGAHNNSRIVSRSAVLSSAKLLYYKLFAYAYGVAGNRADVVLVNSSWTLGHVQDLWTGSGVKALIVNPPCDVEEFLKIPLEREGEDRMGGEGGGRGPLWITSVSQFRPEKDHKLQLRSFSEFIKSQGSDSYKLILVGSCRNAEDDSRVQELRNLSSSLNISHRVEFKLNVSFDELKKILSRTTIGLHTMWNEHFGIGVVECMAAGTVVLAHNSGGPKLDIVVDHNKKLTGFLADDEKTYSDAMNKIFSLTPAERLKIRENARESVKRFSDSEFERKFVNATNELF